jgi:hypothetical protein
MTTKTKATKAIKCGKCEGKGEIACYRAILGGTCFACQGRGTKEVAASWKPSRSYSCVYAGKGLFAVRAKSEAQALRLAVGHWKCHPDAPAFVGITQDQITVALKP